jgi:hypothetical protein
MKRSHTAIFQLARTVLIATLVSGGLAGCTAATEDESANVGGEDDAITEGGKIARMRDLLDELTALGHLNFEHDATISWEAQRGGLTREVMRMAHEFLQSPPPGLELEHASNAVGGYSAAQGGDVMMQTLYSLCPRELRGASWSGQSFSSRISYLASSYQLDGRPEEPVTFEVSGMALKSYSLELTIAEHEVTVAIPIGSKPSSTAQLVADAINAAAEPIVASCTGSKALDFSKNPGRVAGIHARVEGTVVHLSADWSE